MMSGLMGIATMFRTKKPKSRRQCWRFMLMMGLCLIGALVAGELFGMLISKRYRVQISIFDLSCNSGHLG
jgi:hypothetical protein